MEKEYSWSTEPILVPLLCRPYEWNAIHIAVYIAECSGSSLVLLHILSAGEEERETDAFLDRVKDYAARRGVSTISERRGGDDVVSTIVNAAEERNCQLIVTPARSEHLLKKVFGTVSQGVARESRKPVLVAFTPSPDVKIPERISKILIVATEKELDAEPFVSAAALTSSATAVDVQLLAVRVVEIPMATSLDPDGLSQVFKEEEREFAHAVGTYTSHLGRLFIPKIIFARVAEEAIVDLVKSSQVDLIVHQARRPRILGGMLGRVESAVAERAPCVTLFVFPSREQR